MDMKQRHFIMELVARGLVGILFPPLAVYDCGFFAQVLVLTSMLVGAALGFMWGIVGLGIFMALGMAIVVGELTALFIAAVNIKKSKGQNIPWRFHITRRDAVKFAAHAALSFFLPPIACKGAGCMGFLQIVMYTLLGLPFCGTFAGSLLALLIYLKQHNFYRQPA